MAVAEPLVQPAPCSTPYGIRGSAALPLLQAHVSGHVLNALRHQRFSRGACAPLRSSEPSAQRLTASEVQQPCSLVAAIIAWLCSTPYGIRGSAVGLPVNQRAGRLVLNALRHQRFSSSAFWSTRCSNSCAQRLTASEVQQCAPLKPLPHKHSRDWSARWKAYLKATKLLSYFS